MGGLSYDLTSPYPIGILAALRRIIYLNRINRLQGL
jgi:hypothetical protein